MNANLTERQLRYSTIVVLFTLVLFAMTSNVVFSSLGRVSATFGVPSELFSAAVSVQFIGYVVTCLLIGIISDRFGKKRMLVGSCVAAALGALGWTVSPICAEPVAALLRLFGGNPSKEVVAVVSVSIGALLLGGGGGVLEGMGSAILTDLHPDKSKYYMNLSQIAYCVGAIVPTMIVGKLYPMGLSWQWAFAAVALSSVAMALVCLPMCLPENSQGRAEHGSFRSVMKILPSVAIPSICQFCYVFPETGMATFLGIYLKDYLHAPENMSIYCLPLFWGSVIAGRLLCAYLPQKQRYEWIIGTLMLLSGGVIACQTIVTSWKVSMFLFALTGFAFSGIWPLNVSLATTRNLEDSGAATGITISAGAMGCIVNPIVMGPMLHRSYVNASFLLLSGMLCLGAVLMVGSLFFDRRGNR